MVSFAYACREVSLVSCMSGLAYDTKVIVESDLGDVLREETNRLICENNLESSKEGELGEVLRK